MRKRVSEYILNLFLHEQFPDVFWVAYANCLTLFFYLYLRYDKRRHSKTGKLFLHNIVKYYFKMCDKEISEYLIIHQASSTSRSEDESYKWNRNTTLALIQLYKKYRGQVGSLRIKNLRRMFEEIAKELRYATKQNISPAHCENRWKHLERSYKKVIDNNNQTGRGRKDHEYKDEMDEIFEKKKNVHPQRLLSSTTVHVPKSMSAVQTEVEIPQKVVVPNEELKIGSKQSKNQLQSKRKQKLDTLLAIKQDRKDFYKDLLQEKKRKNELYERRTKVLEQLLEKNYNIPSDLTD
uniref:Uncharacterized protein LOC114331462 n=2 Tax=Diabrotica virgifera virgifera TaxID=50390 RepID=A0A6P7FLF2_DIAVI